MNFVAVAIVSAIVLGHPFNERVVFDWFKLHSPLFNNSDNNRQERSKISWEVSPKNIL